MIAEVCAESRLKEAWFFGSEYLLADPLISTFSRNNVTILRKIQEKRHVYAGGRREMAERVSHEMYDPWKAGRDKTTRTRGWKGWQRRLETFARNRKDIWAAIRRFNYELWDKADIMAMRPCICAHRNAFVTTIGIKRDSGISAASFPADARVWMDRWMIRLKRLACKTRAVVAYVGFCRREGKENFWGRKWEKRDVRREERTRKSKYYL